MKLSTKSRYGLRILLQIAIDNKDGKAAQGKAIARKQDISEPYLEQIMIPLKTAGLVRTTRGCNGGYFLNKKPEEITVLNIIELFEGEFNLVDCVADHKACNRTKTCQTINVWKRLAQALKSTAEKITLQSILEDRNGITSEYII
ncbi:MAG TPA: Rrf2 family transcriptional regulator [Lentisphaeria bacterium]|nr:MAG: hypothetical protein A2X45_17600 [Lentisphaerae bacterium GWF2_50_93]HCE43183.1 Rrf2 family transcriptional regulator [Lentisphaeria bacterium]